MLTPTIKKEILRPPLLKLTFGKEENLRIFAQANDCAFGDYRASRCDERRRPAVQASSIWRLIAITRESSAI
jgi:methylphosphotriester-DNA--protein-cysteine methyltransferase